LQNIPADILLLLAPCAQLFSDRVWVHAPRWLIGACLPAGRPLLSPNQVAHTARSRLKRQPQTEADLALAAGAGDGHKVVSVLDAAVPIIAVCSCVHPYAASVSSPTVREGLSRPLPKPSLTVGLLTL